jgi:beta-exotoxin I transport system permease protein
VTAATIYRRWIRDRRWSTVSWTVGSVLVMVATAAFYPSLADLGESFTDSGAAMSAVLGLGSGVDASSPLGYLWISLYANVFPWILMALGVSLGGAAIAGDEDTGALEYLLSKAVTRTTVLLARLAAAMTILLFVAVVSALSLVASLPFFELADATTATAPDGTTVTVPGATVGDIASGTFAAFAVAVGLTGIAFLLGAATGRRSIAMGVAAAVGVGGYVLYTLSSMTSSLDALTWVSPWRWYVDDVMLIDGLSGNVLLPFVTATVSVAAGWWIFLHRDLRGG